MAGAWKKKKAKRGDRVPGNAHLQVPPQSEKCICKAQASRWITNFKVPTFEVGSIFAFDFFLTRRLGSNRSLWLFFSLPVALPFQISTFTFFKFFYRYIHHHDSFNFNNSIAQVQYEAFSSFHCDVSEQMMLTVSPGLFLTCLPQKLTFSFFLSLSLSPISNHENGIIFNESYSVLLRQTFLSLWNCFQMRNSLQSGHYDLSQWSFVWVYGENIRSKAKAVQGRD